MKTTICASGLLLLALACLNAGERAIVAAANGEESQTAAAQAEKSKRRTGVLAGAVLAKGDSKDGRNGWVEIKADGEEKGRKYWPVGAPKGGGPDREILSAIRAVQIGARVQIEWIDAGDGKDISKFEVVRAKK